MLMTSQFLLSVQRKMLTHCEEYGESHGIRFNASKTQLICFRRTSHPYSSRFWFCSQLLPLVDSVLHLGSTLQHDLSDKLGIQCKMMAFIHQANSVLCCLRPLTLLPRCGCFMLTVSPITAALFGGSTALFCILLGYHLIKLLEEFGFSPVTATLLFFIQLG